MFQVEQEIIEKARDFCPKWGGCLAGDLSRCCNAVEMKGSYLIVEPTEKSHEYPCSNCIKVESVHVCLCSVRKEIYRKYEM